jgi:hypothetical protein
MSQNPFSASSFGTGMIEPPKTSILAISSLVMGLLCCIPGPGLLAVLLGSIGLIRIRTSEGRKSGRGLAIAGILLGILVSIAWVFIAIGAVTFAQAFAQQAGRVTTLLQTPSPTAIRAALSPQAAAIVTDERWNAFRTEIEAEIGPIQPVPTSFLELMGKYSQVSTQMQSVRGRNDVFPLPVIGTKGTALMLVNIKRDQPVTNSSGQPVDIVNAIFSITSGIEVVLPSGKVVTLFSADELQAAPAPTTPAPTTPVGP